MGRISPASLAGRRSMMGRCNSRGKYRFDTGQPRRAAGVRAAKISSREALQRAAIARGAPGLVGIHEKYNLNDPRLVWYHDENRIPPWRDTRNHGQWRKLARGENELEEADKLHWLTGLGALDRIRIVLVGSQSAGNVGSVCRLASNFECRQVWLVNPECDYGADEARQMAMNPVAKSLLDGVSVAKSIPEAIAECHMAIGFTRREGRQRIIDLPFTKLTLPSRKTITALVFGREDDGLTSEELAYCTHTCRIPTTKWEGSLNVSQAVALSLFKLFRSSERHQMLETEADPETSRYLTPTEISPIGDVHLLMKRLRYVLRCSNEAASTVSKPEFTTPRKLLVALRGIFNRARVTRRELNMFHGFLSLVESNCRTVADLHSDLLDKASDGEGDDEEDYEEFLEKAVGCQKGLVNERKWEEFEFSETDEEEERKIREELENY